MGGGKNYNYDKSLMDMLRDLENMMIGGLHMWGSGNYKTNFAPKVHDKNILEFDFNEFMSYVDEASSAIKRMDNLEGRKDYIEILKKLNEVREAVLENASAEEIQVKVEAYQYVIHKQDLPKVTSINEILTDDGVKTTINYEAGIRYKKTSGAYDTLPALYLKDTIWLKEVINNSKSKHTFDRVILFK
ncbi:MAG: hypothetical protein P1U44_09720 [Vicingaceae bacterium]|nr:hypothetical protein [Vicingaceae bacterium]